MIRTSSVWFVLFAAFLFRPALSAQDAPGKVFGYEVSAAWLGLTPKGNVLTNSNRVDFVTDLGMESMQSQVAFRFLMKPWDRSGIFFEFTPYRFDGENTITRSFRFGGVTYSENDRVTSKANMNYFALGYQYDMINRPRLELELQAAMAYLGVQAKANSLSVGSAEVNRNIPFPLVGLVARYSPAEKSWFSIRGEGRAMTFGSYGRYIEVDAALAFRLSPHVSLEPGYRVVDGVGHHAARGAELNFRGPAITLRFRDE